MPIIAVNAAPNVVQTFPTAGAVVGTMFAIPARTRQSSLGLVISFDADPGVSQYTVEGSLDGTNFVLLDTLNGVDDTALDFTDDPCGWTFIRVSQAAKANTVVTSVTAQLV